MGMEEFEEKKREVGREKRQSGGEEVKRNSLNSDWKMKQW